MLVISNHSLDYSLNCTQLSLITIIYQYTRPDREHSYRKKKFNRHVAKKCILQSTLYHLVARIDNNREIETLGRERERVIYFVTFR